MSHDDQGNIWCHQCKMRKPRVICCDNREAHCNGRYCDACITRNYNEDIETLEKLEVWFCYRCSRRCICASCKRKRLKMTDGDVKKKPKTRVMVTTPPPVPLVVVEEKIPTAELGKEVARLSHMIEQLRQEQSIMLQFLLSNIVESKGL